jgi:hypothetical protein
MAVMGIEKINFKWQVKKINWLTLPGFIGGILVILLQLQFLESGNQMP